MAGLKQKAHLIPLQIVRTSTIEEVQIDTGHKHKRKIEELKVSADLNRVQEILKSKLAREGWQMSLCTMSVSAIDRVYKQSVTSSSN